MALVMGALVMGALVMGALVMGYCPTCATRGSASGQNSGGQYLDNGVCVTCRHIARFASAKRMSVEVTISLTSTRSNPK